MARIGSYPIDAVIQDKDAWIGTENTNRVTRQFTALGVAQYIDTKNVGLVFVGATNLLPGKKGLVPAPLAGQEGMFLKGDLNGGWTTIPVYTLDVPTGTTNVNLINTDGAGAIINSFITLTGGTYLTSVHTSGSQITFNHDDTVRTDPANPTPTPAPGATLDLVSAVASNATGHVTGVTTSTVTWPADSTYTIDVPNGTTSINLKGSDGTDDAIAFTTVAGNNGMTISRTNENILNFNSKWQINNVNQDGYVPKGLANANKFWATDGNGNPGWTFQPSQDQTLTSTGTTNASTGIVLSQNGGTVIVKGDGSTITAVNTQATNTITLSAINRVNTTYTLPIGAVTAGDNLAKIELTDNAAVVSTITINGTANKIAISETAGNNGQITIGMPDDVTVTGELTVSGTGQSSFGGQITIPQTPSADTDAASKKYVDDLVSGGLTFRGTFNAATGEILSGVSDGSYLYNCPGGAGTRIAVAVGDYYIVATAGGSFYCSGVTLDIGDSIIATAAASADASVVTGWSVVQSDEGVASFTNANGTFVSAGTVNSNATGAVTMGTIDLSATGTKDGTTFLRGDNTWAVPAYVSYSAMTTSTLGLGKIKYDNNSTPAANSQSTTTARTYGVTKNSSDQLIVNVPWLNSSDVNSVTASGATTALSGLSSTPNTGAVVIGLDINGRESLGSPAADDELMIYDTSTAKNVKVLVSDLASYAGSAATNQVTYWTSANEIGGGAGFTFAGGANGTVAMAGDLTLTGGTAYGLSITTSGTQDTIKIDRAANDDNAIIKYQTASADKWIVGLRNTSDDNFRFYNYGTSTDSLVIDTSGTVVGTGTYSGGGSVKIFEAQRSGGAVKSDWDYHDASPIRMSIGTSTSHSFAIKTADTPRLTIDNSGASTFAGDINISSPGDLYINSGTAYNNIGSIFLSNQRTEISSTIVDGTANGDTALNFKTRSGGTTASAMLIDEFRKVSIPAYADGIKFEIKSSSGSNNSIIEMGQVGSDGFLDVSEAGGAIVTHLSGYTGYASYFLSNVGIGTATAGEKLEINGNIRIYNSSNAPYIDFVESGATTDSKARITMDQVDTNNGKLIFSTENAGTLTPALTISQSQSAIFAGTISSSSISAEGMITVTQNDIGGGEGVGLRIIRSGGAQIWNITSGQTGADNTTFNIRNSTSHTNVFSINASTNTAILTGNDLHVGGASAARLKTDGTDTYIDAIPASSSIVFRNSGSVEKMRITSGGLIQASSGGGGFRVVSDSGNPSNLIEYYYSSSYNHGIKVLNDRSLTMYSTTGDNNAKLTFETEGTERMRITSSGDVESPTTLGFKLNAPASNFTYPSYGFIGHTGRGMAMANANELNIVMGGASRHKLKSGRNTAYVADGLWGTNATPDVINSASGNGLYFGYQDNGSGLYAAAYGFLTISTDGLGNTSSQEVLQLKNDSSGLIVWTVSNLGAVVARGSITSNGSPSDRKLKENIKPIDSALTTINKLQGVSFDWKEDASILDEKEDYGFIAQDVQKVLPEIIKEDEVGTLSMRYNSVIPILVESVKELEKVVKDLKKEIIELKNK